MKRRMLMLALISVGCGSAGLRADEANWKMLLKAISNMQGEKAVRQMCTVAAEHEDGVVHIGPFGAQHAPEGEEVADSMMHLPIDDAKGVCELYQAKREAKREKNAAVFAALVNRSELVSDEALEQVCEVADQPEDDVMPPGSRVYVNRGGAQVSETHVPDCPIILNTYDDACWLCEAFRNRQ